MRGCDEWEMGQCVLEVLSRCRWCELDLRGLFWGSNEVADMGEDEDETGEADEFIRCWTEDGICSVNGEMARLC